MRIARLPPSPAGPEAIIPLGDTSRPADRSHPRTLGWVRTASLAMGGSNQSLFLLGALLLGQGTAALPLLVVGLALSLMAMPGWIELLLMWPNRVGGIAAVCGEAFRPYSAVLANLAGTCYWWGWVPTCGLTALLSASALHTWYLPGIPVTLLAVALLVLLTGLNFLGIRRVTSFTVLLAAGAGSLAFLSVVVPVFAGQVDWQVATHYSLISPFDGVFGSITSAMAGLYLIGFAAPAFEAAGCHVGETIDPVRNVPRAFYASAGMAGLFFVAVPIVWLGVIGPHGLEGDLASTLGPTLSPLLGGMARGAAVWLIVLNMFHGTLQPLAGASRTLSQLAEDGLLPRLFALRTATDVPWVATGATAGMSIIFLLLGDPVWLIAAANLTYLIGIALPSVAVWLLRRHSPDLVRPYRASRGMIGLGLVAAGAWGLSAVLGFQQFGLPTVVFGVALAYSGTALYALRLWQDRRADGRRGLRNSLHTKLTGAMLLVMTLDSVGYLIAVQYVDSSNPALNSALEDIFVAVSLITISVGLILPGVISQTAKEVADAADRLATGTLADFTVAMESFAAGELDGPDARIDTQRVVVHSADEIGAMAHSFNTMQDAVGRAATALHVAREELRGSRADLRRLADTDTLTGVANRRTFDQELARELASESGHRGAVLVVDLDNFKFVNDSYGHATGDSVLCQVAAMLLDRLRSTDLVARLGGDEFAVLLRDVSPDNAKVVATGLRDSVRAARYAVDGTHTLRLSVSIGLTTFERGDPIGPADLLVNADIAMHDAKTAGRDRVAVAESDVHQARVKASQGWLDRMQDALDQDLLELHGQPILDLTTGVVHSHELLIRMRSETGDLIPPMAFLEIAERSGMIRDIDHWVLRSACRMITEAQADGQVLRLQINVSGVSIGDAEFSRLIEPHLVSLAGSGLGDRLVIELTETAAVGNLGRATAFATDLARHGCRFALDDFGAGFGGFYYLKYLPCQFLKIDGEFIKSLPTSPVDQVFVRSMVELARGLGKATIAEFVEDEETLVLLRSLGVDYAQGYHIGRPAPLLQPTCAQVT